MSVTKHASSYVKFLNLLDAVRQMPALPVLDAVEERLLSAVLAAREVGEFLPVTEVARIVEGTPERTAFRRIKSLYDRGLLSYEPSPFDQRVKYLVPTSLAEKYFDTLGKCMEQARDSLWRTAPDSGSKHP